MRDMTLDVYALMTSRVINRGINDDEKESFLQAKRFIELVQATEKPLYKGSDVSFESYYVANKS